MPATTRPDARTDQTGSGDAAATRSAPASTWFVRNERGTRVLAAVLVVVLSGIGFSMMTGTGDGATGDDLSSIGDFLQPATGADGIVRIKYDGPNGTVSLANGGIVPISDDLQLEVSVSPYPPTDFDIDVQLRLITGEGTTVTDASILAVWDMPFMWHGPFETEFGSAGDGTYRAPFNFFMFGPWELLTHVTAPGFTEPDPLNLSIYVWPE